MEAENAISTANISIGKKLVDGCKSCFLKAHNAFGKSFDALAELEEIKMNVNEDALADATLFKFLADLFNSIIKNRQNNALIRELNENQSLTEQRNAKLFKYLGKELEENFNLVAGEKEKISKLLSSKIGSENITKLLFAPPAGQVLFAANMIKSAVEKGTSDEELVKQLESLFGKENLALTLTRATQMLTASPVNFATETLEKTSNIAFKVRKQ